ncbi:MAG: EpsG family protein, partial [Clostridia bacterium]|nr:EpsG family protein [Clostridia bacterium]
NFKILIFTALILLSVTFVGEFTDLLSTALEDTTYSSAADQIASSASYESGSNILRALIAFVPAILALLKKKTVDETAPEYIRCCINFSIVAAGFNLIAAFTSGMLMGRISIYFSMYSAILIPWLLEKCYSKQERMMIIPTAIVLYYITYRRELSNWYYYSDKLTWFNQY